MYSKLNPDAKKREMEESQRKDLKRRINDNSFPLEWRAACARALGWGIEVIEIDTVLITTHNNREFEIHGTWGI